MVLDQSGTYNDLIPNAIGCDSLINIQLTVNTVDLGVDQTDNVLTALATEADFQWLDCDDNHEPIQGEVSSQFTALQNGSFAVEVEQNGCEAVSDCFDVTSIHVLLPTQVGFAVYPNPFGNILHLEHENMFEAELVTVYNLLGEEILRSTTTYPSTVLDMSHVDPGTYVVRFAERQIRVVKN